MAEKVSHWTLLFKEFRALYVYFIQKTRHTRDNEKPKKPENIVHSTSRKVKKQDTTKTWIV